MLRYTAKWTERIGYQVVSISAPHFKQPSSLVRMEGALRWQPATCGATRKPAVLESRDEPCGHCSVLGFDCACVWRSVDPEIGSMSITVKKQCKNEYVYPFCTLLLSVQGECAH